MQYQPRHLVDFHTHAFPQKVARKATDTIRAYYHLAPGVEGTPEQLLKSGSAAGVDRYVLLPVATRPDQVQSINFFAAQTQLDHPEIICFGAIHAQCDQLETVVQSVLDAGLRGIKIHPEFQGFALDDTRLFPVYDAIAGRIPVLFHCGDLHSDLSHPRRVRRVLELFPTLDVVAAHLGGWNEYEEGQRYLVDTRCYVDASSSVRFLPRELSLRYIRAFGAQRVLFGTDWPIFEAADEVGVIRSLGLTDEECEDIFWRNAYRLLGIGEG